MADETMQAETIADPAPAPEAVPAPAAVEEKKPAEQEAVEAPKEEEPPSKAEKRIKQLVARQREAEREASYWRGVAEGHGRAVSTAPAKDTQNAPKVEDFTEYDDYLVAKAEYVIEQKQAQKQQASVIQQLDGQFQSRIAAATAEDPALQDIMNDASLPVSPTMATVIKTSEKAPDILRYLDKNRDEAMKIYKQDPMTAARSLLKIEIKLENIPPPEPTRKVSRAPEPVKPGTSKASGPVGLEDLPMDEFVRRRNKEAQGR